MPNSTLCNKNIGQCSPKDLEKAQQEQGSCLVTTTHKPNLTNDRIRVAFIMGRKEWRTGTRFVSAEKHQQYIKSINTLEAKGFIKVTILNPAL